MRVNVLILLALSAVTAANSGCTSCRNWLHRGSICGTRTASPAMMGSPVALGTPYVQQPQQFMQPMAAPMQQMPMQQMVMPQANCQCAPQCIPMCQPMPSCQPCCDPCANMGGLSTWSGGYMDGGCCEESTTPASTYDGGTIVPSTGQPSLPSTYVPQGTSPLTTDPGPARVNYPESTKPADETN